MEPKKYNPFVVVNNPTTKPLPKTKIITMTKTMTMTMTISKAKYLAN